MAKARKQKGDEQKPDGCGGATVLHQKLCLSIDMENQLIYGPPTLYGVPKVVIPPPVVQEISSDQNTKADSTIPQLAKPQEPSTSTPSVREVLPTSGPTKDADNISNCSERRNVVKIRVKLSTSSSKADDADHRDHSRGRRNENEAGPCSSMSVDAPMVGAPNEPSNVSNHNIEEQNSCHDRESRISAGVSNARLTDKHEISKELQRRADSRLGAVPKDQFSPVNAQEGLDKPGSQHGGVSTSYDGNQPPESMSGLETKEKKKKDKKDKKRNRDEKRDKKDDPEYLEKKRLKREKKKMEKEFAKKQEEGEGVSSSEQQNVVKPSNSQGTLPARPPAPARGAEPQASDKETTVDIARTTATTKIRIKVKPLAKIN